MKHIKKILVIALAALMVLTVFTACSASPEKKLIGSWRDSTGITGYEFKEDGKCVITFAEILFINGSVDGVYSVSKRDDGNYYVTITYTLHKKSFTEDYMFVVEDSSLTLTDTSDSSVTVLIAYNNTPDSTVASTVASTAA